MNYSGAKEKRKERLAAILDAIKNGTFDRRTAAEVFGTTNSSICNDLGMLRVRYPEIKLTRNARTNEVKYFWEEKEIEAKPETKVVEEEKEEVKTETKNEDDRYPATKTDEGYPDPSAQFALGMDDIFGWIEPGTAWNVQGSNGCIYQFVVLRSFKGWVSCLQIFSDLAEYSPVYCVPVDLYTRAYVDCRRILTKPSKYFIEKSFDLKNFDRVKEKVRWLLDIPAEEKIVEKPVEKIVVKNVEKKVEVPVEVIKEVEVVKEVPVEVVKEVVKEVPVVPVTVDNGIDAVDFARAKQRADIYELVAWKLLNGICGGGDTND